MIVYVSTYSPIDDQSPLGIYDLGENGVVVQFYDTTESWYSSLEVMLTDAGLQRKDLVKLKREDSLPLLRITPKNAEDIINFTKIIHSRWILPWIELSKDKAVLMNSNTTSEFLDYLAKINAINLLKVGDPISGEIVGSTYILEHEI
jgi:hypothetical protein